MRFLSSPVNRLKAHAVMVRAQREPEPEPKSGHQEPEPEPEPNRLKQLWVKNKLTNQGWDRDPKEPGIGPSSPRDP